MAKYEVTRRGACRICGLEDLVPYLEFPDMPFTDDFLRPDRTGGEFLWPITIFHCPRCDVSQTLCDVDVRDYYRQYQYSVAASPFAQEFMRHLAQETWRSAGLGPGDRVIEVGSSDGAQLSFFQQLGAQVFGFEPSAPLAEESRRRGVPVAQRLFDGRGLEHVPPGLRPAQVILLTYTFDHLPEPLRFLDDARKALDPRRGVLVIEVHDLAKIFERGEYCLFAHEHSIYLTDATLQRVLERAGFVLLSTNVVPESKRRGNSLLVLAAPAGSERAGEALPPIPVGRFGQAGTYADFGRAAEARLERFREALHARRREGRSLAGYGAGGRGVMTLAQAGLTERDVAFVCDVNPNLHGLRCPKSHVPVVPPDHLLRNFVDETIVFSFGYLDEIRRQLHEYVERGGRLVSLLDALKV